MEYWTAEGFIRGIEKSEDKPQHTLKNMLLIIEKQARELLTERGYGIDPSYLTPNDDQQNRNTWLNEAFHLLDYDLYFEEDKAAITLIEAAKVEDYLAEGKTYEAALSMANITALTLLPNDLISQDALSKAKAKHKKSSKEGGKAKLGYKGETRLLIECYYNDFITGEINPDKINKMTAEHLANIVLTKLSYEVDLNRVGTRTEDVRLDDKTILYTVIKTGKTKRINIDNLANIIREIKTE